VFVCLNFVMSFYFYCKCECVVVYFVVVGCRVMVWLDDVVVVSLLGCVCFLVLCELW